MEKENYLQVREIELADGWVDRWTKRYIDRWTEMKIYEE